jgi:hypothetical protein
MKKNDKNNENLDTLSLPDGYSPNISKYKKKLNDSTEELS